LIFAMLLPPEAYPNGKMAVILCATFAFLIALSERKIAHSYLRIGAWIFGLLVLHTMVVSIDLYRSLDTLTTLWAYYCLIGFFAYSSAGLEKYLAGTIVGLALIVSGYGLYQYFWGFDQIYQYIFYSGSDQVLRVPALQRIATKRVFSTLALPGTLWGFLVCALPFHAMLWKKHRVLDGVLILSAILVLTAGFLTRSFGFLLGLFVLALTATWLRHRKVLWNRVTPVVLLVLIIAGAGFYSARRGVIEGQNPAGLRFLNWVSAWNIFAVHPMGTGLNTFGVAYPEYMQPFANETQFVHNTPLQLLSELGWPLIAAVIISIALKAGRLRRSALAENQRFWLMLALAVWITHNLVDINVYFASVGVMGAVIIGALLAREQREFPRYSPLSLGLAGTFGVVVMVFAGLAFVSSELQHRAQIEFDNKKFLVAADTLAMARKICPINSSLHHDAGELLLNIYHQTRDRKYLTEATESFRTAIALSPKKSGSHIGYGLCLSTANQMPEALEQIRIAQQLFPSSAYAQSIHQLMLRER